MDAVEEQLNHSLARLENEKEKVASITGFQWIINIPLIAPYTKLQSIRY
jgi:hypothetical protein